MQRDLAQPQLADTQRKAELNQTLQDMLFGMFENPTLPKNFLDLAGDGNQLFEDVGAGVMRNSMFNKLMGLGGNVGTGGIQGFAQNANLQDMNRRGEEMDTVANLVQTLLMGKLGGGTPAPTVPPGGQVPVSPMIPWALPANPTAPTGLSYHPNPPGAPGGTF
jgi:hypothetical protein